MSNGNCIFEGQLGEIHAPDLLTFLDMLGKTGTFEIEHPTHGVRRLHWSSGEIVFADSTLSGEDLPGYLLRNGVSAPDALSKAAESATDEASLISGLIREGALEAAQLPRALRSLVMEIIYSLFEWQEGRFRFLFTEKPHAERVVLRTSVSNIIMEASRRLDEWPRIREAFPHDGCKLTRTDTSSEGCKLESSEQEILDALDGTMTIAELVRAVSHDHFETVSALHGLLSHRLLTVEITEPEAAPVTEPMKQPEPVPVPVPAPPADAETTQETEVMLELSEEAALKVVGAFNNIFAGIHERITSVKGDDGKERYAATIRKASFQKNGGVFAGLEFQDDGRLPEPELLANLEEVPAHERLQRLKGSMDRLLAQQVLQMDRSYPSEDKKAISDLIAREKERISIEA
ncbi:MAG: DUF4388 domain-containing protein [Acidobacteriota bacterium]